jgi:antitoxin (DNA-binding transcriptional repressor) of toxin-antitoxin stability system
MSLRQWGTQNATLAMALFPGRPFCYPKSRRQGPWVLSHWPLAEAKEHLDDLIARAARGEDVRIADPVHCTARLVVEAATAADPPSARRVPGRWKGRLGPAPDEFFAPLTKQAAGEMFGAAE